MIRLIVSDIDSTLIDHAGYLPPDNVVALAEANALGVRVALATIRKRDSALYIAEQLGVPCALICNGGASIYSPEGAELAARLIPLELARALAALADAHELPMLATVDEQNFYRPGSHPAAHIVAPGQDVAALLAAIASPPSRFLVRGEPGASLVMRAFADAPLRFVRHYRPDGTLADVTITHAEATKERALALLCQAWSIAPAELLALGDAEADIGMLELAGVGVAVGNAQPEVQAIADWVAPPAAEGGVAAAVRRFVLGAARTHE